MNLERLREFPDYDITTLPPLPEGYFDASSYIDAAPSFENEERGLKVYVDYANYADRESGRSQRFCVSRYDEEEGDYEDVALSTNDWAEVIRFLTARNSVPSPFQGAEYNPPPMRHSDFDQRLAALGALPVHRGRIVRVWLQGQALDIGTRRRSSENFLPLALRDAVPALTAN